MALAVEAARGGPGGIPLIAVASDRQTLDSAMAISEGTGGPEDDFLRQRRQVVVLLAQTQNGVRQRHAQKTLRSETADSLR